MNTSAVRHSALKACPSPLILAHFSDTHICLPGQLLYNKIDTAAYLQQAVAALLVFPQTISALIITGDLVDQGSPEEYQHLQHLLAPLRDTGMPIYVLPGNHDERNHLHSCLADLADLQLAPDIFPFIQYRFETEGFQVVALDTHIPGSPAGALCPQRLEWLITQLRDSPDKPTLIAMHHPPYVSGIHHMDQMGLKEGAVQLEQIIGNHPKVQRIICGHLHRHTSVQFGHGIAATIPSTAHQIKLSFDRQAKGGWAFEPPGFALYTALPDQSRLVAHWVNCPLLPAQNMAHQ